MSDGILTWEVPAPAVPPEEHRACRGGGVAGAYEPNMPDERKAAWKASLKGARSGDLRVEVRKSTGITRGGSVQVLIVVRPDGSVGMSMSGTARFSQEDWEDLRLAADEARRALALHQMGRRLGRDLAEEG